MSLIKKDKYTSKQSQDQFGNIIENENDQTGLIPTV
jgi:hypothetical protein